MLHPMLHPMLHLMLHFTLHLMLHLMLYPQSGRPLRVLMAHFFEKIHDLGLESQLPQFISTTMLLTMMITFKELFTAIEEAKKSDNDEQDEANKSSNEHH